MSVRFSSLAMEGCCTWRISASIFCDRPRAWRNSLSGISAIILFALSDARARACGVMRARSSENFLAIDKALFPQLLQMLVVKPVGNRNMDFIPAIAAGLVAANQQDGRAAWVKCIQGSQGTTIMLRPQFSHV